MGQAQINVRTRACSRTSIARTKQAALTHSVRGKRLRHSTPGRSSIAGPAHKFPGFGATVIYYIIIVFINIS